MTEIGIIHSIQALRNPVLDFCMLSLSILGSRLIFMVVLPFVYWVVDRRKGWMLAVTFLFSMQINSVVKVVTDVPRPYEVESSVKLVGPAPVSTSFPSGHAQGSVTLWGGLALIFPSFLMILTAGLVIPLVAFTRIYLGVHYPLDIGMGWCMGVVALACLAGWIAVDRHSSGGLRMGRSCWILLTVTAGFIAAFPARDVWLSGGVLIGLILAERMGGNLFSEIRAPSYRCRLFRLIAGYGPASVYLGILLLLRELIELPLMVYGLFFMGLGFWMALGAPWLFTRFGLLKN
jgi:glycerophosphoryl diester phosphodiesterase